MFGILLQLEIANKKLSTTWRERSSKRAYWGDGMFWKVGVYVNSFAEDRPSTTTGAAGPLRTLPKEPRRRWGLLARVEPGRQMAISVFWAENSCSEQVRRIFYWKINQLLICSFVKMFPNFNLMPNKIQNPPGIWRRSEFHNGLVWLHCKAGSEVGQLTVRLEVKRLTHAETCRKGRRGLCNGRSRPYFFYKDTWCHYYYSKLSVSDHVNSVMSSCAQSMHALRTLRSHGMDTELLQTVYRAVIIAKLLYASSAWWGFTTASDRRRMEASLRRAQRSELYPTNKPTLTTVVCQHYFTTNCTGSTSLSECSTSLPWPSTGVSGIKHRRTSSTTVFQCPMSVSYTHLTLPTIYSV